LAVGCWLRNFFQARWQKLFAGFFKKKVPCQQPALIIYTSA
jgi:hypothetical protein